MSAKVVGKITVIKRNGSSGSQFSLTGSQCTFGRNAECEIRIQLPTVSDRECTLSADENGNFILSKMNKVGEVLINDQKVDCDAAVKNNDILTIAGRSFRFEYPPRMKMFGNAVSSSSSSPNIVGTPKSALIERVKQSRSRRVSFGPQLSPEQFASYLPPDTPVKKGAIPMQSLSNTDEDNKCAGVLSESNRRSSGRRASPKNSKSTKDSTRKTGGKRSFDELVALVGLDKLLPKSAQRKQCSRGKQSTQIQTGASQFTPKEKKTPKRRSKQITPKFNPVDVVSMFSASPEKHKSKSSKYTPTGRDSIVKTAHTPGPECADSRDAFTETPTGKIRSREQDLRKTSKISEVSLVSSKKQTAEKSAAAPVQFNSRSQAEVSRMENADNEPVHQTMDDTVLCESPLPHKDLAPERRSINVKVQTPKALDSVEKEVETSPGADRATLARRQSSVKGRTPKPVGDGPDDPSLDDTVPLYAVTPSLAENRRSSVKVVENTPIGQENVEFIPEEGDKVSQEDASTNEKDGTIPFEAEKTEPGAYAIPPQEDATESAYSFESNDALPNDEPLSADQLPTFSDTSRALNLEKNVSLGLDDTVAIEEFGAALPKEDCKTPGGRRKSGAGKMPKTATTGGRRSPVHFTTPKAGDHETHEVSQEDATTNENDHTIPFEAEKTEADAYETPPQEDATESAYSIESDCALPYDEPSTADELPTLSDTSRGKNASLGLDDTVAIGEFRNDLPKEDCKTPAGRRMSGAAKTPVAFVNGTPNLSTHRSAGKTPKTASNTPTTGGRRSSVHLTTPKAGDHGKHEVTKRKGTPVPWKTSDSAKKTPARGRRSFSHSRGPPTTPYTRTPKPDKKIHGVTKVADQTPVNPSASQMTPKSSKKIPAGSIGKTPKTSSCNPEAGGQRSSLCLVTPMACDDESPLPPKALDLVENAAETFPGANRATPARRRSSVKGGTPKPVGDGPEDPSLDDTVPLDAVIPSVAKNRRNSVKRVENTPIGQENVEFIPGEGDKVSQEVAASYESDDTIPFEAEETEADAYETLPQEDTAESAYIIESDDMLPNDKPPSADQLPTFSNTPRVLKLDENVSMDLNDTAPIEEIGSALHKEDSMTPAGERSGAAKTPAASVNGTPNLSTHRSSGKTPKSVTNTPATSWRRSSVHLTTPKADDHEILEVTKRKGTPVPWKTIDSAKKTPARDRKSVSGPPEPPTTEVTDSIPFTLSASQMTPKSAKKTPAEVGTPAAPTPVANRGISKSAKKTRAARGRKSISGSQETPSTLYTTTKTPKPDKKTPGVTAVSDQTPVTPSVSDMTPKSAKKTPAGSIAQISVGKTPKTFTCNPMAVGRKSSMCLATPKASDYESPLPPKDPTPIRGGSNVTAQTPKALDPVVEPSPGATLARRRSSVKGRTPKSVGDGPDDPSLDDTVPYDAVNLSLAKNRRSRVNGVENTPIGQEDVEFNPEEGDKVSQEDARTNESDDTIPFETVKTEPGAYETPPQEDATEFAYHSVESDGTLSYDEPPRADQLPTFSDTPRMLKLNENVSTGLDDTAPIEEFAAAIHKEDCKIPGGKRSGAAKTPMASVNGTPNLSTYRSSGKMPKSTTNTPATGGRRSSVHLTTPKVGDHEAHEATKRKGTPVPWKTSESAKKTPARGRGRKSVSGSQEPPTTPYATTRTPKPDKKTLGLSELTHPTSVTPSASRMTPMSAKKFNPVEVTAPAALTPVVIGRTPKAAEKSTPGAGLPSPLAFGQTEKQVKQTPAGSDITFLIEKTPRATPIHSVPITPVSSETPTRISLSMKTPASSEPSIPLPHGASTHTPATTKTPKSVKGTPVGTPSSTETPVLTRASRKTPKSVKKTPSAPVSTTPMSSLTPAEADSNPVPSPRVTRRTPGTGRRRSVSKTRRSVLLSAKKKRKSGVLLWSQIVRKNADQESEKRPALTLPQQQKPAKRPLVTVPKTPQQLCHVDSPATIYIGRSSRKRDGLTPVQFDMSTDYSSEVESDITEDPMQASSHDIADAIHNFGTAERVKTPKVKGQPVEDHFGTKRLLKTPKDKVKGQSVEDHFGTKRLLKTPKDKVKGQPVEEHFGTKRLLKTPKDKVKGQPVEEHFGTKRLLTTPRDKVKGQEVKEYLGTKRLLQTPKERVKGQMVEKHFGTKRLLQTPKERVKGQAVEEHFGTKRLLRTPRDKTKSQSVSKDFGIAQMMGVRREKYSPVNEKFGMKRLLRSPKVKSISEPVEDEYGFEMIFGSEEKQQEEPGTPSRDDSADSEEKRQEEPENPSRDSPADSEEKRQEEPETPSRDDPADSEEKRQEEPETPSRDDPADSEEKRQEETENPSRDDPADSEEKRQEEPETPSRDDSADSEETQQGETESPSRDDSEEKRQEEPETPSRDDPADSEEKRQEEPETPSRDDPADSEEKRQEETENPSRDDPADSEEKRQEETENPSSDDPADSEEMTSCVEKVAETQSVNTKPVTQVEKPDKSSRVQRSTKGKRTATMKKVAPMLQDPPKRPQRKRNSPLADCFLLTPIKKTRSEPEKKNLSKRATATRNIMVDDSVPKDISDKDMGSAKVKSDKISTKVQGKHTLATGPAPRPTRSGLTKQISEKKPVKQLTQTHMGSAKAKSATARAESVPGTRPPSAARSARSRPTKKMLEKMPAEQPPRTNTAHEKKLDPIPEADETKNSADVSEKKFQTTARPNRKIRVGEKLAAVTEMDETKNSADGVVSENIETTSRPRGKKLAAVPETGEIRNSADVSEKKVQTIARPTRKIKAGKQLAAVPETDEAHNNCADAVVSKEGIETTARPTHSTRGKKLAAVPETEETKNLADVSEKKVQTTARPTHKIRVERKLAAVPEIDETKNSAAAVVSEKIETTSRATRTTRGKKVVAEPGAGETKNSANAVVSEKNIETTARPTRKIRVGKKLAAVPEDNETKNSVDAADSGEGIETTARPTRTTRGKKLAPVPVTEETHNSADASEKKVQTTARPIRTTRGKKLAPVSEIDQTKNSADAVVSEKKNQTTAKPIDEIRVGINIVELPKTDKTLPGRSTRSRKTTPDAKDGPDDNQKLSTTTVSKRSTRPRKTSAEASDDMTSAVQKRQNTAATSGKVSARFKRSTRGEKKQKPPADKTRSSGVAEDLDSSEKKTNLVAGVEKAPQPKRQARGKNTVPCVGEVAKPAPSPMRNDRVGRTPTTRVPRKRKASQSSSSEAPQALPKRKNTRPAKKVAAPSSEPSKASTRVSKNAPKGQTITSEEKFVSFIGEDTKPARTDENVDVGQAPTARVARKRKASENSDSEAPLALPKRKNTRTAKKVAAQSSEASKTSTTVGKIVPKGQTTAKTSTTPAPVRKSTRQRKIK